jgi:hypothetical protein
LNVSVGLKLVLVRFLNSSILLLAINYDSATQWFDGGGLVYDASILIILMAISNPITYVLDPYGWYKKLRICMYKGQGSECQLT